jgi:penicillin-binding protein 1C
MPAAVAWLVADILSDNAARVPTFGLDSVLRTPYWTAVKTGTSKDMRDNWALGFSERYSVGVWLGNANGEPMHDVSGVSGAAPLWRDTMDRLHASLPSAQPAAPPDIRHTTVRFEPRVEGERVESFLAGTERAVVQALSDADQLATQRVSIVNPVRGSRLALDPDIPAEHQHVVLQANVRSPLIWRMDGRVLTDASWTPVPGHHRLEVFAAGDNGLHTVLDHIELDVRGLR